MRPAWLAAAFLTFVACGAPEPDDPLRPSDAGSAEGADGGPAAADLSEPEDPVDPGDGDAVRIDDLGGLRASKQLRATMVDVGQGDGLVVQLPGGKVLAVDGGPSPNDYIDALRARGIRRVDYAVLSHAHSDHYTGLTPVLTSLVPADCLGRVLDPGLERTEVTGYRDFKAAAGCRYQKVGIGQTLNLDPDVEIVVLSAHAQRFGGTDDSHGINNTSVVVRLRYRRFSLLLQGDAEQPAEQDVATAMPTLLRSTVLKAGHHGSCTATGTTYLGLVAPQYLLMSLAADNTYGMPHCQTLSKLRARSGLRWARTDVNGSVTVTTDGSRYVVSLGRGSDSATACPRDCAVPLDF